MMTIEGHPSWNWFELKAGNLDQQADSVDNWCILSASLFSLASLVADPVIINNQHPYSCSGCAAVSRTYHWMPHISYIRNWNGFLVIRSCLAYWGNMSQMRCHSSCAGWRWRLTAAAAAGVGGAAGEKASCGLAGGSVVGAATWMAGFTIGVDAHHVFQGFLYQPAFFFQVCSLYSPLLSICVVPVGSTVNTFVWQCIARLQHVTHCSNRWQSSPLCYSMRCDYVVKYSMYNKCIYQSISFTLTHNPCTDSRLSLWSWLAVHQVGTLPTVSDHSLYG